MAMVTEGRGRIVDNHVIARRRWIDRGSDGDEVEAAAEEEEVIIAGVKRFGSGALDRAPRSICFRWPIAVCMELGWLGTSGHVFGAEEDGSWLLGTMKSHEREEDDEEMRRRQWGAEQFLMANQRGY
eukprot:scaffold15468_cov87-Cyclotella_meneghiniana.AAC.8